MSEEIPSVDEPAEAPADESAPRASQTPKPAEVKEPGEGTKSPESSKAPKTPESSKAPGTPERPKPAEEPPETETPARPQEIRPGSRVRNKAFGEGRVIRVYEGKATVAFDGPAGEKTIHVDYLKPTGEAPVEEPTGDPSSPREETPRQQRLRGQKRAVGAASKKGIRLRKKMAFERLSNGQYDPLQDLLEPNEMQEFMDSGGKKLPKDILASHPPDLGGSGHGGRAGAHPARAVRRARPH
jgi:hypothetical protein